MFNHQKPRGLKEASDTLKGMEKEKGMLNPRAHPALCEATVAGVYAKHLASSGPQRICMGHLLCAGSHGSHTEPQEQRMRMEEVYTEPWMRPSHHGNQSQVFQKRVCISWPLSTPGTHFLLCQDPIPRVCCLRAEPGSCLGLPSAFPRQSVQAVQMLLQIHLSLLRWLCPAVGGGGFLFPPL